jgi:hypothetical protein
MYSEKAAKQNQPVLCITEKGLFSWTFANQDKNKGLKK